MIIGIGVDIVAVKRIADWEKKPGLIERFFPDEEISDSYNSGKERAMSLAARFAAKEAFGKALGIGLSGIKLKDIRVSGDELGKPKLELTGSALDAFKKANGGIAHLSLAHEKDNAVAFVIIEGKNG